MESAARDERVNKAKETVLATRRCVHACCLSLCQQPTCHDESNLKGLERRQWTTNGLIEARLDLCGQHLTQAPLGNVRGLFCCSLAMPQHSKGSHDDLNSPGPSLSNLSQTPTFGSIQNVPFLFSQTSVPQTPRSHPWAPPPQFSPSKAFPSQEELTDVDMSEISPLKYEERDTDQVRPVAAGAMRRVYKQRVKSPGSKIYGRRRKENDLDSDPGSGSENDEDNGSIVPIGRQNTSNHFTLNMPAHPAPQSDTPYILLGFIFYVFFKCCSSNNVLDIYNSSSTYPSSFYFCTSSCNSF